MTYLYIKEHAVTGLRYFGKTTRDPYSYNGSGKYWTSHCNKHGWTINTVWTEQFDDLALCQEFAELFSDFFDIVESDSWANLKPETLDGGSAVGVKKSEHARKAMSIAKLGKPTNRGTNYRNGRIDSGETKAKRRASLTGRTLSEEHKAHCRIANLGKKDTDETKAKKSVAQKLAWIKRKANKEQI